MRSLLTEQDFGTTTWEYEILENRKMQVRSFVQIDNGIAVLSDLRKNTSYIYAGNFGQNIGISQNGLIIDSAFEDEIFNCIPADDLIERHVLELRYFHFQRANEIRERKNYNTICLIHFQLQNGNTIPVLHRSYYLESLPNGSIWLSLCTYTPYIETPTLTSGQIVNNKNGKVVQQKEYQLYDNLLLSPREKEVLTEQARNEGKPENIIEKMVIGRINKYYKEVCLVDQLFIKDDELTITKLLKARNAEVARFARFALGEGIEKKQENFAEEVASFMK